MAGLLYLPRIFVYHSECGNELKINQIFKIMERKLFFYIMFPAMFFSWVFGILLVHSIGVESLASKWMQIKILAVILLTMYHFFLMKCLNEFSSNNNQFSSKFYRIINEVPTILLIIIIFVVVFKPL